MLPPTLSVAISVKLTLPVDWGVPSIVRLFVLFGGILIPEIAPVTLVTVSARFPVPPVAVIVWL